jgi:hypothetical protein
MDSTNSPRMPGPEPANPNLQQSTPAPAQSTSQLPKVSEPTSNKSVQSLEQTAVESATQARELEKPEKKPSISLNESERQRLNQILDRFSPPGSEGTIEIRNREGVQYRGEVGKTPEIDRITPQKLQKLERVLENPEQYKGELTITYRQQVLQISSGNVKEAQVPGHDRASHDLSQQLLAERVLERLELERQRLEMERMRLELERIRIALDYQTQILQRSQPPMQERLGNWMNNLRDQVQDQVGQWKDQVVERFQALSKGVNDTWLAAQDKAFSLNDRLTGKKDFNQAVETQNVRANYGLKPQKEGHQTVSLLELNQWRREAGTLNRSHGHLERIDKLLEHANKHAKGASSPVAIRDIDHRTMQRDRGDYVRQQLKNNEQAVSKSQDMGR